MDTIINLYLQGRKRARLEAGEDDYCAIYTHNFKYVKSARETYKRGNSNVDFEYKLTGRMYHCTICGCSIQLLLSSNEQKVWDYSDLMHAGKMTCDDMVMDRVLR